jgi:membrane fusion protein (multidrug efflux system)
VLVRLDPADYEARVAHARADVEAAKNHMAQSSAASEAASAQAHAAAVKLKHAEQELERANGLFERKVSSQNQLDSATAERDAAVAELRAAQQRELAERAMIANQAPVLQAEASLREAELALEHTVITAPFDGDVGRKSAELGANGFPVRRSGACRARGQLDQRQLKETQVGRMRVGDPVEIEVDAYPDQCSAAVESISPATGASTRRCRRTTPPATSPRSCSAFRCASRSTPTHEAPRTSQPAPTTSCPWVFR